MTQADVITSGSDGRRRGVFGADSMGSGLTPGRADVNVTGRRLGRPRTSSVGDARDDVTPPFAARRARSVAGPYISSASDRALVDQVTLSQVRPDYSTAQS